MTGQEISLRQVIDMAGQGVKRSLDEILGEVAALERDIAESDELKDDAPLLMQELEDVKVSIAKRKPVAPEDKVRVMPAGAAGQSRLEVFGVWSQRLLNGQEGERQPESFVATWNTGSFDAISIEYYNGSLAGTEGTSQAPAFIANELIWLNQEYVTVVGAGGYDALDNYQPMGKVLDHMTFTNTTPRDFCGTVHVPGRGRSIHYEQFIDAKNSKGDTISNGWICTDDRIDDQYWSIFKVCRYLNTSDRKKYLVVKIQKLEFSPTILQKRLRYKQIQQKIAVFFLQFIGLRNQETGEMELQVPLDADPAAVAASKRYLAEIQKRDQQLLPV